MSGPGPSAGELETILTIGARVPDHGKLTPWRFIVFEGEARARAGDVIAAVFARKNPGAPAADIEMEKRRQMDAPLVQNYAPPARPSFGDRVSNCLSEATASGLGPSESAAYSRACATR